MTFTALGVGLGRGRFLIGVACLATLGCESREARAAREQVQRRVRAIYSRETGRLQQLAYDSNDDGKADSRAYLDGIRLLRVEMDDDGDGRVDRWEYYASDAAPRASPSDFSQSVSVARPWPDATLARVEISASRDGKISRREFFERGLLARIEEDTDGDGVTDKWATYVNGTLSMVALDLEHRGAANRRFVYVQGGALERIEIDANGDGVFESTRSVNDRSGAASSPADRR